MIARFSAWDARASVRLQIARGPGLLRWAAIVLAHSGDSWFWLFGLGIVWLAGPEDWKGRVLLMAAAILVTAVLVMILKFTIRRQRPAGEWGAIYRRTDPHSFPSGHAARAFLLPVLALATGPAWFVVALWVWAPLVGLSRVAMGVHYLSDIVAGAAFGAAIGLVFLQLAGFFFS
ncbi:MAG TPA: phosphatase PAP2 family protein [Anaerolineales bacterium]|nr:phosphatase PAP2 family protein [Anaerolineales bacterium]